jgi:alkanesulfonate monooxygenase SsuD/methylene tetrahydromethanopterin reductase-like flavin-dependent oxidoreductase (luciferase family)
MGFATLASYAPGRVIAGLGASSPIIVEGWYGRAFGQPVATVREFIAVLRQALSAGRPDSEPPAAVILPTELVLPRERGADRVATLRSRRSATLRY